MTKTKTTLSSICLLHHTLAARGGEERMHALLANALNFRGYDVTSVMTEQFSNERNVYELDEGIRQYSLQRNRVERKLNKWFPMLLIWRYRHILKKHNVKVVIDVGSPKSLCTTKAVEGLDIKVICWDHFNYEAFRKRWCYDDLSQLIRKGRIHRLVVLTQADVKSYLQNEDYPKDVIYQIYNPSPIQTSTYMRHPSKKVLACGRLHPQKGFDLLLDAWREVEQKNADWELEIVGDGPQRQELKQQVKNNQLQRVSISHFTNNIQEKYSESGIFVLSSRYEGFPLVLLEAESMSLPMVSFDCKTGPAEIVRHGYNGFLAEAENAHDLAEKLLAVMNDDDLRKQMGRNAFESSRQFSTDRIINQWEVLIKQLRFYNED